MDAPTHSMLRQALDRADAYSQASDEPCYVFDGRWDGKRFVHLIPAAWIADSDWDHIVYASISGHEVAMIGRGWTA